MPIKLYLQSNTKTGSDWGDLSFTEPSFLRLNTGWLVATYSSPRYTRMDFGVLTSAFSSTVVPNDDFHYNYDNCFVYGPVTFVLPSETWNFSFEVIATDGGTQDGRLRLKVWKSSILNATDTDVTDITDTILTSTYTNLSTTAQLLTASYLMPEVALIDEYLFIEIAQEVTGAGDSSQRNVYLCVGPNNFIEIPDESTEFVLVPNDSTHSFTSGNVTFLVLLETEDSSHNLYSDNINLSFTAIVNSSYHSIESAEILLWAGFNVYDSYHQLLSDTILNLTSTNPQDVDLNPDDSYHNHHSDDVGFPREYIYKVLWNGKDISTEIVGYSRDNHICNGIGTLTLTIKGNSTRNFIPWSIIELFENDVKKGRYYVSSVEKIKPSLMTVLSCQDETKKLQDYFISENHIVDFPSRTRYWLEKFLDEATVDYVFDTDGLGEPISNNTSFGMTFALDEVTRLCQQSGWYFYADGYGTIHIGKLEVDTNAYKAILNDYTAESLSVNKNDRMLRNRVIVWGSASFTYDKWIFAEESTITPYNYDLADIRTAVLSNSNIESIGFAQTLATRILKETEKITEVKTVNVIGYIDLTVGDTVYVNSKFYKGTGIVTTINANISTNGAITTIIIDERCPRLYGYFDLGGYVYIGTAGNGVWRKPLKWEHTWEDYSTGITDLNIQDLAINNGLFACVTYTGDLYTRTLWDSGWSKVSATGFMDITPSGTTYSGIPASGYFSFEQVECKAVTINQANNEVMAVFNTRGSTFWSGGLIWPSGVQRSWLYTSPGEGNYTVVPITISGEELEYDITAYDLDTNQNYPVISVMKIIPVDIFDVDSTYLGLNSSVTGINQEASFNVLPSSENKEEVILENYGIIQYTSESRSNIIREHKAAIGYYSNVHPKTGVRLASLTGSSGTYLTIKDEYYDINTLTYKYTNYKNITLAFSRVFSGHIYSDNLEDRAYAIENYNGTFKRYSVDIPTSSLLSTTDLFTLDPQWEYTLLDTANNDEYFYQLYRGRITTEGDLPLDYSFRAFLIKINLKTGDYNITETDTFIITYDQSQSGFLFSSKDGLSFNTNVNPRIQVFGTKAVVILFVSRNFQTDYYLLDTNNGISSGEVYYDASLTNTGAQRYFHQYSLSGFIYNQKSYAFAEFKFDNGSTTYNGIVCSIYLRAYVVMNLATGNVDVKVYKRLYGLGATRYDDLTGLDIHTWGTTQRTLSSKYLNETGMMSVIAPRTIQLRNPFDATLEKTYTLSSEWTIVDVVMGADDIEDCFYVVAKNSNYSDVNRLVGIDFSSGEVVKWFKDHTIASLTASYLEHYYYHLVLDFFCYRQGTSRWADRITGLVQKTTRDQMGYALIRYIENEFEEVAYPSSPLKVECSKTYPFLAYGGFSGYGSNMGYLYASALGEKGNWLNLNLIPENYFVHDGRVFDTITESGNSRCIIVASETQTSGESSIKLFDINHLLSSGWDQGGTITFSGIDVDGESIDIVFSGYPISSIYYSTIFYSFSGYVTRLETTNYQDSPYIFAALSGVTPTFYQKDSYYFGELDTPFIDRTNNMPSGIVTIIRCDDRI